jgi:hypothetical protein
MYEETLPKKGNLMSGNIELVDRMIDESMDSYQPKHQPSSAAADKEIVVSQTPLGPVKRGHVKITVIIVSVVLLVLWCLDRYNKAMSMEVARQTFNTTWFHVVVTGIPVTSLLLLIRRIRQQHSRTVSWHKEFVEDFLGPIKRSGSIESGRLPDYRVFQKFVGMQVTLLLPVTFITLGSTIFTTRFIDQLYKTPNAKPGFEAAMFILGGIVLIVVTLQRWLVGIGSRN